MMKPYSTAFFPLLALALAAVPAAGQVPSTARALGMGGAYVASARGQEAIFQNPANLGLAGSPEWSVALTQLGVGTSLSGPRFADLPDLLNFDDIAQSRRDELLARVPESGAEVAVDTRVPLFAMQTGRVGLAVSYGMTGAHTLGRDIVDLLLNGYQDGRTDYSVGNTAGWRASYLDFAAAYGRKVGPVSLGATGHYFHGRSVAHSRMFEPRFDLEAQDFSVDYVGVLAEGGRGWGVDLGAAVQPHRTLTLSAAVANAFTRMRWSDELHVRSVTLRGEDLRQLDEPFWIREEYERSDTRLDPAAVPVRVYQTALPLYREAYFPTTVRAGAAWAPLKGMEIGAAYQGNVTTGRMGGWWDRSVSVGVQQKLPLVRVRAGAATNLEEGTLLSGGVSLGPIQLGAARLRDGTLREGWIATFGISTRTRAELP